MTPSPAAPGLPLPRRSAHRRLLITLAIVVLLIAAVVPAVSAETITGSIRDPQYEVLQYPSAQNPSLGAAYIPINKWSISFNNSARYYPSQIVLRDAFSPQTEETFAATPNYRVYNGTMDYGTAEHGDFKVEFQKMSYDTAKEGGYYTVVINVIWNQTKIASLSDRWYIDVFAFLAADLDEVKTNTKILWADRSETPFGPATIGNLYTTPTKLPYTTSGIITYSMVKDTFDQNYVITTDEHGININLTRVINGKTNPSKIIVTTLTGEIVYESPEYIDINRTYEFPRTDLVVSLESYYNPDRRYEIYRGDPADPGDTSRVMVHIIALDARNENLLLDAAVEVRDQYDAVVAAGTTSPEGWMVFEYDLPDTLTDEDFDRYYTVSVSLPGWTQKVTNFKFYPAFIPRSGDWIRVEMLPDTDGPADPEKTYIMFFVRDIHANPLERASIEIAGQYWHTNSAGHVAVEVPKNSTTAYTVRKTGHVSISGSAAVGAEGSYVVNIALGPALPDRTPGPGDDPGATPPPRDTRTNEEKGKAVIDLIADNAELIATLAILAAVMGLINLIMPGRRRR